MDSERYVIATTTGYLTDSSPRDGSVIETEIMVMDRAYNCAVIYRRYVRHRSNSAGSRRLQRELRAARDWAVGNLS